jgi:hypothetical protein
MVFILLFVLLNTLLSTGKQYVISLLHLNQSVLKDQQNINHIQ